MSKRIEDVPALAADVISARALAPLVTLLSYAKPHLTENGRCLFLKGENFQHEITESLVSWRFQSEVLTSQTNPSAVVLRIKDIHRA
jgi:16S rRNA (guanine527-N7)-methyltransferase